MDIINCYSSDEESYQDEVQPEIRKRKKNFKIRPDDKRGKHGRVPKHMEQCTFQPALNFALDRNNNLQAILDALRSVEICEGDIYTLKELAIFDIWCYSGIQNL